jgi:hypothetical protein
MTPFSGREAERKRSRESAGVILSVLCEGSQAELQGRKLNG